MLSHVVVVTSMYCMGHITWGTLHGAHCMGHIAWGTLHGAHCMGHIAWGTLRGVHSVFLICLHQHCARHAHNTFILN